MGKLKIVDGDRLDAALTSLANSIRAKAQTTEMMIFPEGFCKTVDEMELADQMRMKALDLFLTDQLVEYTSDVEGTMVTYAFQNCTQLQSITLTGITRHGNYSFMNCSGLKYARMDKAEQIGTGGFVGCTSLTEVHMPMIREIGKNAFGRCAALAYLDAYDTVKINSTAFNGCTSLQTLILRSETVAELLAVDAMNGTPIASGTGYIYVPAALVEAYQAAENWSTFAAQFRAIEDYPEITGGGDA